MHGAVKIGRPRSRGKGDGKTLYVDGQKGWGVLKNGNFHGRHLRIILISTARFESFTKKTCF